MKIIILLIALIMFNSCKSQDFTKAAKAAKYVVQVCGYKYDTATIGPKYDSITIGSGVIIEENGYIVTNNHIVKNLDDFFIIYNNDTLKATIIGNNKSLDISILKVNKNLPHIKIGKSDNLKIGQSILIIGFPLNIGKIVTGGIIGSFLKININGNDMTMIENDAALNIGNSGGALISLDGKLIGINSMLITNTGYYIGYSFAIPIDQVISYADSLINIQ